MPRWRSRAKTASVPARADSAAAAGSRRRCMRCLYRRGAGLFRQRDADRHAAMAQGPGRADRRRLRLPDAARRARLAYGDGGRLRPGAGTRAPVATTARPLPPIRRSSSRRSTKGKKTPRVSPACSCRRRVRGPGCGVCSSDLFFSRAFLGFGLRYFGATSCLAGRYHCGRFRKAADRSAANGTPLCALRRGCGIAGDAAGRRAPATFARRRNRDRRRRTRAHRADRSGDHRIAVSSGCTVSPGIATGSARSALRHRAGIGRPPCLAAYIERALAASHLARDCVRPARMPSVARAASGPRGCGRSDRRCSRAPAPW